MIKVITNNSYYLCNFYFIEFNILYRPNYRPIYYISLYSIFLKNKTKQPKIKQNKQQQQKKNRFSR